MTLVPKLTLTLSSGLWSKHAGEALRSPTVEGGSQHRRHAVDCRCHGQLGWTVEQSM